eukprot:3434509-Amphidinium_carterae.1
MAPDEQVWNTALAKGRGRGPIRHLRKLADRLGWIPRPDASRASTAQKKESQGETCRFFGARVQEYRPQAAAAGVERLGAPAARSIHARFKKNCCMEKFGNVVKKGMLLVENSVEYQI